MTFTVTLDRVPAGAEVVTVDYATADGTALAGSDYTATGGTLTFNSTTGASLPITVTILDDTTVESSENFGVLLSNASGNATIADAAGDGTITDDDFVIQSITDETAAESAGSMTFTVTLDRAPTGAEVVTVDYATADGTALAGSDYTATGGTLTFNSTTGASLPITVTILDDATVESSENFGVLLSNASGNATIADAAGDGTITDDDFVVQSITDETAAESAGSMTFTVTLDRAPTGAEVVTVDYATADGTALAGSDYTATGGTLTFNSTTGASLPITVTILDDATVESSENFGVLLSNASGNATIADAAGDGTITDDDFVVQSITDETAAESAGSMTFTVTLDRVPAGAEVVTVDYATADGSAAAGCDYTTTIGTLTFDSGTGPPRPLR